MIYNKEIFESIHKTSRYGDKLYCKSGVVEYYFYLNVDSYDPYNQIIGRSWAENSGETCGVNEKSIPFLTGFKIISNEECDNLAKRAFTKLI